MEAVLERLQTLTSDQLRDQITGAGLKCGPITATTRSIFEKKLARVLLDGGDVAVVHSGSSHPVEEQPISENENTEETNHDAETPAESPSVYYGVCPQSDDPSVENGSPHVYVDKTKALKAVMKLKGARFKAFASKEDAENFAKGLCEGGASPRKPSPEKPDAEWPLSADVANAEKANEFRSPRTQDLTAKLRKTVERGDEEAFRELVWGNPRYLIGSGDNPTIVQVICERKNKSKEVKQKITEYLEDRFYVPLLRAADNTLPPVIGVPWCPGSLESCDRFYGPDRMMDSPKNPIKSIKAFVGPLNSSKAEEFHRLWKTPPRDRSGYFRHILKSDSERGAERVGRELAREMGYPWAEFWDFLNCFVDLSSREGLKMLDEHLRNTEDSLINASGSCCLSFLHSPEEEEPDESRAFPVCDLMQEFEKVLLSADHMNRTADSGWQSDDDGSSCSSEEYFTADEDERETWSDGRFDPNASGSSGSSFKSTHSTTDPDTGPVDRHRSDVFILGDSPTKLDSEVLLALDDVEIDPLSHHNITRWKNKILSYSLSQRQSWPSASQMSRDAARSSASTPNGFTISPKFRSPAHFNPGQFLFSPPSKSYRRL